jgi:hypothetical protein
MEAHCVPGCKVAIEFRQQLENVQEFTDATLPLLGQLLQAFISSNTDAPELAVLIRSVLKIFWSSIYMDIPAVLANDPALSQQWLQVCSFSMTACMKGWVTCFSQSHTIIISAFQDAVMLPCMHWCDYVLDVLMRMHVLHSMLLTSVVCRWTPII